MMRLLARKHHKNLYEALSYRKRIGRFAELLPTVRAFVRRRPATRERFLRSRGYLKFATMKV
jgi:hypothetical protein